MEVVEYSGDAQSNSGDIPAGVVARRFGTAVVALI